MYKVITKPQELGELLTDIHTNDIIGLDVEATTLDPYTANLLLVQLNVNNKIYLLDVRQLGIKYIAYIVDLIKSTNKLSVGHNIKYDIKILYHNTKLMLYNVYDTMLGELIPRVGLNYKFPSYKELVEKYCFIILDKEVRSSFIDYDGPLTNEQLTYSALDVKYLFDIREEQLKDIRKTNQEHILELEMGTLVEVAKMEYFGILLSPELWRENIAEVEVLAKETNKRLIDYFINSLDLSKYKTTKELANAFVIPIKGKKLEVELENLSPEYGIKWIMENVNIGSTYQCREILNHLGIPVKSTGEEVIKRYKSNDFVSMLLDFRGLEKLLTGYGENILAKINPVTDRVHSEFDQLKVSGRFGSSGPNLQNQPKSQKYRRCYIAPRGKKLITADLSQAELRLLGEVSGEIAFIDAYIHGQDIHKKSATILYDVSIEQVTKGQRSKGKTLNFSLNYGITPWGLLDKFDIPLEEGEELIKKYFKGLPSIAAFIDIVGKSVWKNKVSITPFGRKRFFEDKKLYKDAHEEERYKAQTKREGVNHVIQGGIADIIKKAMVSIGREKTYTDDEFKLLLQVHDELVFEVDEDIVEEASLFIKYIMEREEQVFLGKIPAVVDIIIADCWSKE